MSVCYDSNGNHILKLQIFPEIILLSCVNGFRLTVYGLITTFQTGRMQIRSFIMAFIITVNVNAQPDPTQFYPKRIQEITKTLVESPNNYQLIWERLEMQMTLLYG